MPRGGGHQDEGLAQEDAQVEEKSLDSPRNSIQLGDCIAGMNALPEGTVDFAFADPPFNIGYDYDVYHDRKQREEYLSWSRAWIAAVHRVLKPDGTFWLAIGDEYAAELKLVSQDLGFHLRSWVIWYYTFGVNCKTKFSRSHAHLFYFAKDPRQFTFRASELENRIPSARLLVYGDSRGHPEGRLPDDTWILRPQDLAGHFTPDEDTWYFPRVAGTFKERAGFHGCQMPEQLLGRIIRLCSHEKEIVLDPFSGSATTLAVAKKLGRQFLGFDVSPDYVKQGTDRLAAIRVGDALEGAPEPTMSAPATSARRSEHSKTNRTPLDVILENSAEAQQQRSRAAFLDGLIEAFRRVNQGYSLDRVIADPDLNKALADECLRRGLPGDIRWWNRNLFGARKAGKLAHIPTGRRTELSWERCDRFLFASEIAWKQCLDLGYLSLDEILCDPNSAAEFDRLASNLAPNFSALEYRWGALKLRKESKRARARAGMLVTRRFRAPFLPPIEAVAQELCKVPESAGIYMVFDAAGKRPLYAGEALLLQSRMKQHFEEALQTWKGWATDLTVRYYTAASETPLLLANQLLCVRKFAPLLNVPEPAVP
jgi:site-specific DNA-methyltransferase (adenine-specific)